MREEIVKFNLRSNNLNLLLALTSFLIFILAFIPLTSATFSLGTPNYSVSKIYGPSSNINGWINISFSNEPTNSLFSDSFENSVSLRDVLNKSSSPYTYSCTPLGCGNDYSVANQQTTKTFDLGAGSSKMIGLKFTGSVSSVNSISFDIESNAGPSCTSQLKIDLINDEVNDLQNNKSAEEQSCFA